MGLLKKYTIPLQGQGNDIQEYDYQLDSDFFTHFEGSLVQEGKFNVQVRFERKAGVMELTLDVQGNYATQCDRCLEPMQQEVDASHLMLIKYGEEVKDDGEVMFIPAAYRELDITKILYDYVCLSLPIASYCEEEEACDERLDAFLADANDDVATEEKEEEPTTNPFKDALKDLNLDE